MPSLKNLIGFPYGSLVNSHPFIWVICIELIKKFSASILIVKMWEEVIPYLVNWHPEYSACPKVRQEYNEIV